MKLPILVIAFFLSFILGCKPTYRTHCLVNSTNYSLIINGFRLGGNGISSASAEPIYMDPNSQLTFKRYEGEGYDAKTFYSVEFVDSTIIVFDSKRALSIKCNLQLSAENCHPILEGALKVTITEEDYNNAVPINE